MGAPSSQPNRLAIIGVLVAVILVVAGLFLPPFSLAQRLGLAGQDGTATQVAPTPENAVAPGEVVLTDVTPEGGVTLSRLELADFQVQPQWADIAQQLPAGATVASPIYLLSYSDTPPTGALTVAAPVSDRPAHTLDLYGWDGSAWRFIPSQTDGAQFTTASVPLPQAVALLAAPAAEPRLALLVDQSPLVEAWRPLAQEIVVGALMLEPDGSLSGDVAAVPAGSYRQWVRVTNTSGVLDQASLSTLLADAAAQATHIAQLVERAFAGGYAGVVVDYQGVAAAQSDTYTQFLQSLEAALAAQGLELGILLATPYHNGTEWDTAGQNWAALGALADMVLVNMPALPTAYVSGGQAEQILAWATRHLNRQRLMPLYTTLAVDEVAETHFELSSEAVLAHYGQIELGDAGGNLPPNTAVEASLSGDIGALEWDGASAAYLYTYEQGGQAHTVWLSNPTQLATRLGQSQLFQVRGAAIRGLDNTLFPEAYTTALQSYLSGDPAPAPEAVALVWKVENANGDVIHNIAGGDALTFRWDGAAETGDYTLSASFTQGERLVALDAQPITVVEPVVEEPEPAPAEEVGATGANSDADEPLGTEGVAGSINTSANLRQGPGLGYAVIRILDSGAGVTLTGRDSSASWFLIQPGGDEGWVYAPLITTGSGFDPNALPVIQVEPPVVAVPPPSGSDPAPAPVAPPPVVAPAPITGGFELGGQTHSFGNPSLMASAGMNWVKFQHKWGPGDTPDAVAGRIQQAHASGFKVLLSIPGANTYPSSIDFNAYVSFLGGVAALGPDAIEVWNEMNIDFEWPAGQIDPTSYVTNMLAPAYNAIKAANPNVMVISGAPAPTGFDNGTNAWADDRYMAGVAAAGGANYMDCIGVHHNAGATSPNQTSGHPANSSHYSWYFWPTLDMYYNTFGGARPICFTELGFLSTEDFGSTPPAFGWAAGTSVAEHAQWLAEAVSLSAGSGKVRMLIVFNIDFTYFDPNGDPQAGYGMIRPNGSCPSCDLLRTVMGQ